MLFGQGMTGYRHVLDKDSFMKLQHQTSVAVSYLGKITSQTKSYDVMYELTKELIGNRIIMALNKKHTSVKIGF